jgi:hypothetical protein
MPSSGQQECPPCGHVPWWLSLRSLGPGGTNRETRTFDAMSSRPPVGLRGVDSTDERGSILTNKPSGLTLVVVEQPGTDRGAS